MNPKLKLSQIAGIGPFYVRKLAGLNIFTLEDLIYHFPFRYDDFSTVSNAFDAQEGEKITLIGEVWDIKNIYTRGGRILTQALFNDGTTPITLTWFNQSWLTKQISVGDKLQVSGKLTKYKNKYTIVAPVWEKTWNTMPNVIAKPSLHTGRLVPVYPETEGLTSKWMRTKISAALPKVLPKIEDPLPESIRGSMLSLQDAIQQIHFPISFEEAQRARERIGFDELFYIQLATIKVRKEWESKPTVKKFLITDYRSQITEFIESLPFQLTEAQLRVTNEILADLEKGVAMNRLVQGEVGSGKTVVAAIVMYAAHLNGYKSFYMAPTEILAFQHQATLTRLMEPFGITVGIYTGSKKFTKSTPHRLSVTDQQSLPNIIVGTHALLSDKLMADNVGLIIVDEQQRFGVEQRSVLRSKATVPHFLTMTATPIPRTVALTLYGDLDVSVIDSMPVGRQKVQTYVVPSQKRNDAYKFIEKQIKENADQVYLITPLIELSETLQSAKAATVEFERLRSKIFPDLRLGLLHGRLKSAEKAQVLQDFKDHKLDILVSTSVVEVGVDVPNATIMVIESAERFGLAQLHQLRGRVGRGEKKSYCFLFTEADQPQAVSRLRNMENIDNGLKLAELDLKIRGSGEIFGTRQSGRLELKVASFGDLAAIERSREAARMVLDESPTLDKFPALKEKLASIQGQVAPD